MMVIKEDFLFSPKIVIEILMQDMDYREYAIKYEGILICIQCYIRIEEEVLYLRSIDVEGPGSVYYGSKLFRVITEVEQEFCRFYKAKCIILEGGKRTTGKYKDKYPKPIKICL